MLVEDIFESVDYGGGVFPLVKWSFVSYIGVDSLENLFCFENLFGEFVYLFAFDWVD